VVAVANGGVTAPRAMYVFVACVHPVIVHVCLVVSASSSSMDVTSKGEQGREVACTRP
jgi:hypothetical protein